MGKTTQTKTKLQNIIMRISTLLAITTSIAVSLGGLYLLNTTSPSVDKKFLQDDPILPTPVYDGWIHWKQRYGKTYGTDNDEKYRQTVYYSNWKKVVANNANTDDFEMELNEFADLKSEEFAAIYLGTKVDKTNSTENGSAVIMEYPKELDWSDDKTVVTPVKNQGQCGSCWAFSTTGSVEGAYGIKNKKLVSLSEQQLVDCAGGKYGNMGCNGGLMDNAFQYIMAKGIESESEYPYTAMDGTCMYANGEVEANLSGFKDVTANDSDALLAAVNVGPVSVAIYADPIQLYKSGVFTKACNGQLDHGVLVVGYGTDEKTG